jgi:Helicase associated domain (HA2)
MGALFKCLDPVLTIAAALSGKSPFVRPFGAAAEAAAAQCRKSFAQDRSDSLAVAAVYKVVLLVNSYHSYIVVITLLRVLSQALKLRCLCTATTLYVCNCCKKSV